MKKLIKSIVCLILVFGIFSVYAISSYNIRLGNEVVTLQQPLIMENDRIFVPVRSFCESLGFPVHWDEEKNEVHVDIYNKKISVSDKTEYKEQGVIPDEETAKIVGKAILEKYMDGPVEYETDEKIYYLKVYYNEAYNGWNVFQTFDYKDGSYWVAGDGLPVPTVILNKNTGEVMHINTYSLLE